MTNKITLGAILAVAFLTGMVAIGTSAHAQQSGGIPQALADLETQFAGIQDFLMGIDDRVTQNESDIVNLFGVTTDHENRVSVLEEKTTLSDLSCTTDQIAKFDGTNWICVDDLDKIKNPERYLVTSNDMVLFEFGNLYHYRAQCNPGDHLVTGGVNSDHATFSSQDHKILDSRPNLIDGVETWNVAAAIPDPNNSDKIFVKVLCEKAIP